LRIDIWKFIKFMRMLKKPLELIIILTIILSGLVTLNVFKMANSATFLSLDEILWMPRADVYQSHILEGNFSGFIVTQPGITVMWMASPIIHFIDFDFNVISEIVEYKKGQGSDFNFVNKNNPALYSQFKGLSFLFNIPFLLAIFSAIITGYYLLRRLGFNKNILFIALAFIATTPWLMYFTTPTDKCLIIFMTLSLLFLMVYGNELSVALQKKSKYHKKFLLISAILGAWAALSKLTAFFFIVLIPFILLFYLKPLSKEKIKIVLKDCLIWAVIFFIVCSVFLPTIIFHPQEIIDYFFQTSPTTIEPNPNPLFYFHRIIEYTESFLTYSFIGHISPGSVMSFGLLMITAFFYFIISRFPKVISKNKDLSAFYLFLKNSKENKKIVKIKKHLFVLGVHLLFFTTMVIALSENHDIRFLASAFIIMDIFAALGIYLIVEMLRKKFNFKENIYLVVVFLLIFNQMINIALGGSKFN